MVALAQNKRLIVCADGTWLSSSSGTHAIPSNVAKLARSIATSGLDQNRNVIKQIVYYHAGLGSGDLPLQKALYGGLGWGLDTDVCQIYDFVSNNYVPGDELFFFGFSRGAFTIRSVVGLVCNVGILAATHMSRFAEMWDAFRHNTDGVAFRETPWYLDHHAELGGRVGYGRSFDLEYAFQALALDEKRITFPPTLWHRLSGGPAQRLEQCWFPGVHGNIGGQGQDGVRPGDGEEMGYNTLAWMVDNCSQMLTFEASAITMLVDQHRRVMNANRISNGWGCGTIIDNFAGLQGTFFRLLGRQDRTPGNYPRDAGDGTSGSTNESFHPIVRFRMTKVAAYDPPALRGVSLREPTARRGWAWARKGVEDVPEYVMSPAKKMIVAYDHGGIREFREDLSLSRRLCPPDILTDLDRDNASSELRKSA